MNISKIAKFATVIALLVLCTVMVIVTIMTPANVNENMVHYQTIDQAIERVNDSNINDLIQPMDFVKSSTIPSCQPSEFVRAYIELDPGYIEYLESYFDIVITN